MKRVLVLLFAALLVVSCGKRKQGLVFNPKHSVEGSLEMYDGTEVKYTAYEGLCYVRNVEDSTYQRMNVYVPEGADKHSPIFLRTYIGGYMASQARAPQADDATGRALKEGYVVVIPGARGRNSIQGNLYTGRAPKALLDLKAAVRYLRLFDKKMPGDAERIVVDGTSAGGAMVALLGATGNSKMFEPMLQKMGAAKTSDAVFAVVSYCPITDLEHADMAYEYVYHNTASRRALDADLRVLSLELKDMYPVYLDSLKLTYWDGTPVNSGNYMELLKRELIRSAQVAKNAGADLPDSIGLMFSGSSPASMPPVDGQPGGEMRRREVVRGEYVVDIDMERYLDYVVSTRALKPVPAFDSKDVAGQPPTGENELFGDESGNSVNFTDYSSARSGMTITQPIADRVRMMNPMNFIGAADNAEHWYIRHGARDRDTGFPVSFNLAMKLQNAGLDVNFLFAWNRGHSGDYALDDLFGWLSQVMKK